MKHSGKDILIIKGMIMVGILAICGTIWFSPRPKTETRLVKLDVSDRENGICAQMYKEGFKWGYGQYSVTIATDRITKHTEEEIKDHIYEMAQKGLPEDF